MNTNILAGLTLVTAALAVGCAPANARTTSSPQPQSTVANAPAPTPVSSPTTAVQGTRAQLPTNSRVVDFSVPGGAFKVELKKCTRATDPDGNVICDFVFTANSSKDAALSKQQFGSFDDTFRFFRAFDSTGSVVDIKLARKGNDGWRGNFNGQIFVAQFPTPVSIKFKMPDEDTVVTFLDLMGEKVVRFAQVPIEAP